MNSGDPETKTTRLIQIFNQQDGNCRWKPRNGYRVAPVDVDTEAGERCEIIKSTYDAITKFSKAMFDMQDETVV